MASCVLTVITYNQVKPTAYRFKGKTKVEKHLLLQFSANNITSQNLIVLLAMINPCD